MGIKIRNFNKFLALVLLRKGPKHGYEIMKQVEKKGGNKIAPSQIYPFLNEMKTDGLVEFKKSDLRDKKVYNLTDKGKKFVDSISRKVGGFVDMALEPRIRPCANCGCKFLEGGYEKVVSNKKIMFCCKHCAKNFENKKQ